MNTDAAYVAGLIDGEGCIYIEKAKANIALPTYRARVSIGMTAPALDLLREMQARWGGTLYQLRPATERWAAAWTWYTWGDSATEMLRYVAPFLRLKGQQAAVAMAVEAVRAELPRRRNGNAKWTPEARARCEELKQQMHLLNAKGPSAQTVGAA